MSIHSGPADWWTSNTDGGRNYLSTKGIVTSNLVMNLDTGASNCYPGSGSSITDLAGNYNLTIVNGTTYVNNSIRFNGSNSGAYATGSNVFRTAQFTKCVWFRLNTDIPDDGTIREVMRQSALYFVMSNRGDLTPRHWEIGYNNGTSAKYWQPNTTAITVNTWHHLVVTADAASWNIYYDGVSQANGSTDGNVYTLNPGNFFLGSYGTTDVPFGRYLGVDIAIVNMYNRSLSNTEIVRNFNAQRKRFGV